MQKKRTTYLYKNTWEGINNIINNKFNKFDAYKCSSRKLRCNANAVLLLLLLLYMCGYYDQLLIQNEFVIWATIYIYILDNRVIRVRKR